MTSPGSVEPRIDPGPDWAVLSIVCLGQFMVILDVAVVNVALPAIRDDLGFGPTGLQWVVNAYALTFAGFMLLGGRAADLYGRRRMFLLGLGLFTAASLVGGFAQDETMLIVARAAQGLGGAVLAPATLTILTTHFREPQARARALGIWSAMAAAGGASGAVLGGLLTDLLSWRWILFINVPIGVAGFVAARRVLGESRAEDRTGTLDVAGAVTVTAGLVVLVYGIVETETRSWTSPATISTLAVAAALLVAFVVIEARVASSPLMPLRLFRSRSVTGANLVIFLLGAAMFAMWFFLSLYMQNVLGFSPLETGFAFVPQTMAIVVGAQISSRLVARTGPRPLLLIAPLIAAAGMALLAQLGPDSTYLANVLGPSVLVTLSLGLAFTPVTFAATSGVPVGEAGLASGLVNTTRQIGGAIGLAALATVAADTTIAFTPAGTAPTDAAMTAGFARAFSASVWLLVGAAAAALILPAWTRPRMGDGIVADPEAGARAPASGREGAT